MNKRMLIIIITVILIAACAATYYRLLRNKPKEQSPPRIGVILSGNGRIKGLEGLQAGLVELGYVLGDTLTLEIVNAGNDRDLLSQLVDDLIASQPDMLVALGGIEAEEAKRATAGSELPVIFVNVVSPVKRGLIASRERRQSNLTGVENSLNALIPKRLEMLTRILPDARKILAYYSEDISVSAQSVNIFVQTGRTLQLDTKVIGLQTIEDLGPLVDNLQPTDADVIFQLPSASIRNALPDVLGPAAIRAGIPILSDQILSVPGILMSHGHNNYDIGRQGARLVDKVLRGASPGDIPIELPLLTELNINLNTAKRMGITIPDDILALAAEVIDSRGGQ